MDGTRARAVVLAWALLVVACGPPSWLRSLSAESSAQRYVREFEAAEQRYPGEPRGGAAAPNGQGEVELEAHSLPFLAGGCHAVWLARPGHERRRILTMREADPGSGSSFGFGWSSDSQAVFIYGDHSGIGCPFGGEWTQLRIIYTLEDGVAWELPYRRAAER